MSGLLTALDRVGNGQSANYKMPIEFIISNPLAFGNLPDSHATAIEFNDSTKSPVSILLFIGCPSAVFFAVRQIIIDTINRVIWRRARTYIPEKLSERFSPFLADCRPQSAIAQEASVTLIITTSAHIAPRLIFDGQYAASRVAVGCFKREKRSTSDKCGRSSLSHSTNSNRVAVRALGAVRKPPRPLFLTWRNPQFQSANAALAACRGVVS